MTPREKAKSLKLNYGIDSLAIVREIINVLEHFGYSGIIYDDFETGGITTSDEKEPSQYWYEVIKILVE